jgi:hypothetical protein
MVPPLLDSTRAARGNSSLHLSLAAGVAQGTGMSETKTFPELKNGYFGRAFIYVPARTMPPGDNDHLVLFLSEQQTPYMNYNLGWHYGYLDVGEFEPHDIGKLSPQAFPIDRWVCMEWQYAGQPSNVVNVWLDSLPVPNINLTMWPGPVMDTFRLGLGKKDAPARDVWIDEIALDGMRVGCGR